MKNYTAIAAALAAMTIGAAPTPTCAQAEQRYEIAAQDLASALKAFAAASGREVIASSPLVEGKRSGSATGVHSPEEAIALLLAGTGLRSELVEGAFVIRPPIGAEGAGTGETPLEIVVTGTRIRGAPIASPVINISRESMRAAGQADLGDVVRSIPQSFGGGQNPGIGANVPAASAVNVGGGSSINLRGIGSDATLTLLNGRRIPYSSSRQSVDVSTIPLAAVDRIEIVADGASALYGSDAVAGVANIILRRDFDGIEASARLGASTDGGNFQQHYGALAGRRWAESGFMAAYEFSRSTAITSEDRDYAESRRPGVTLMPPIKRHSAVVSGHTGITSGVELSFDALYNNRRSLLVYPLNPVGDLEVSRLVTSSRAESAILSPQLDIELESGWRLALSGSYGEDEVCFRGDSFSGTLLASSAGGCYENGSLSFEIGGNGDLLDLPAGPLRLATGVGFRRNDFALVRGAGHPQNIGAVRETSFAYGELNLPLVSPARAISFAHRLNVSAAARLEHYPDIGDVVTPKVGLIYAPSPDLDLKASWGRSFRAPTFLQQYQIQQVTLFRATSLGGSGLPANATALLVLGGNEELRPERARSWSTTLAIHPRAIPDLRLELSYFAIRYVDRIVGPITFLSQALSNPIFAAQVTRSPSDAEKAAAIAAADLFTNAVGTPYDPSTVVAIANGRNVNAGRQEVEGVDLLLSYTRALGQLGGTLGLTLNASYLDSRQQLSDAQPVQELAGRLFNPPHLRARGTVSWRQGGLSLAATANYIGGVDDVRAPVPVEVEGMTLLDLTARYRFGAARGPLQDLEIALSVQNLFDAQPDPIMTTSFLDTPYDSTNYSAVGRFLSIAVTKRW